MRSPLPSALPRLARLLAGAHDDDAGPLRVCLVVTRASGAALSEEEVREVTARLAGYDADGPLDELPG